MAGVAAALLIATALLAWLNRGAAVERMRVASGADNDADGVGVSVIAGGERKLITAQDFELIGPSGVSADYKTNLLPAVRKEYTGVSLKSALDYLGVGYSDAKSVSFTAEDGYISAVPIADALDAQNCYIVFGESGKPLETMASGGPGPYMAIFAKDRYSQRWCKYLIEITVK